MTRRLGDEDRRTIDLLLDGAAKSGGGNGSGDGGSHGSGRSEHYSVSHHRIESNDRLSAAQRVLTLLDALPVDEPSTDLVERTMRRIERHTSRVNDARTGLGPTGLISGSQPHA